MAVGVVIVAAGRGRRMQTAASAPKQYRRIGGQSVLRRALLPFVACDEVSDICTVIHPDDVELYESATAGIDERGTNFMTVHGDASRQGSVHAGLKALQATMPDRVLIHDAARPFVSGELIEQVLKGLDKCAACIPVLPVTDTLKEVEAGHVTQTLDRSKICRAQTPQGFRFEAILEAHEAGKSSGLANFTDDASIAEWHGIEVGTVDGEERNMKLTTDADLETAEFRLSGQGEVRVGQGFDVHAFQDGGNLVLGGIEIPFERSLAGHSDADVVLHAVTDAILGAIGDGDIGAHFPPSDSKWKGASSDQFLKDATDRVTALDGVIVNLDVTVICEAPKIGPHREAIRARISEIADVDVERVSVKATTTEKLGFTGRGEGIAAQALATVRLGK